MMPPNHPLRFYSFWALNDRLDADRLRAQLDEMKRFGLDGTVIHPRFYPNDPPYLSDTYLNIVSDLILHAKSNELDVWLYDENGWPSGTAGGQLLEKYPQDRTHWLELSRDVLPSSVHQFKTEGRQWGLNLRPLRNGIDPLRPEPVEHFLSITHERYRQGLMPEAWDHISTIFTDEPETGLSWDKVPTLGAVPWTQDMPARYAERFGEGLLDRLPLLFFRHEGYRDFRVRFWEWVTDLLCEGFIAPYQQWCERHGKLFTGHVKGEEHPLFQVPMCGSCHRVFRGMSLPGIDALERLPSNDFFPRQLGSAAKQFGDGRCMVECFGGAGWGATPEDLERYLLWLGGHGISDFVPHLWQSRLTSHAIRDWPASIPVHVNWAEVFPEVIRRVKGQLAEVSDKPVDTLVLTPHRAIMAEYQPDELAMMNIHNACAYADTPAGGINSRFMKLVEKLSNAEIQHHYADERTFEEGTIGQGVLRIGQCDYNRLLVTEECALNDRGRSLVKQARAAGLDVVFDVQDAPLQYEPVREAVRPILHLQPQWSVGSELDNDLVLEPTLDTDGNWVASFNSSISVDVDVLFADLVIKAELNGHVMQLRSDYGWVSTTAKARLSEGTNTLRFITANERQMSYLALRGRFDVVSQSPIHPGPNGTLMTDGPFNMVAPRNGQCDEYAAGGRPFARRIPCLQTSIDFGSTHEHGMDLVLESVQADAVRVWLGEVDMGFTYRPDWRITIPDGLAKGRQRLAIELIPSTFNFFGPHHHIDGDRHVTSPDHFAGRKTFTDRPDAPESTRTTAWHFKPTCPPTAITLTALRQGAEACVNGQT